MEATHIVVLVTAGSPQEAERISRGLLEARCAACVNIVPAVQSLFWWQGKIDRADEVMMVIKTRKDLFSSLVETVRGLHGYQVPEILALPVIEGHRDYLTWLDESVRPS